MTDFAKDILISAAGILLTGVAGIALFNPCKRWLAERRKRKQQRADCEAQRDKTLAELKEMLREVGGREDRSGRATRNRARLHCGKMG